MINNNFYCKKKCGDPNFSIDKWNELYRERESMGLSESESNRLLFPDEFSEPCKTQCGTCMDIVLDTQIKNRNKRKENENRQI